MERPDVDSIEGLSPAISIEQKTTSRSPRSTVGTITEIYDYLRVLYSSIGIPHCPVCGNPISRQTTEQILQHVLALRPEDRIMVMAPIVRGRKGEYRKDLEKLARQGFVRARIDGVLRSLDDDIPPLDKRRNHTIEVVVGPGSASAHMNHWLREAARLLRFDLSAPFEELPKKTQKLLLEGGNGFPGILKILDQSFQEAGEGYREWLTDYMSPTECPDCHGKRLRPSSLAVRVKAISIADFTAMPIARALLTARSWQFGERETQIAGRVVDEIRRRLEFLSAVGLDYLSLERSAATLSGGEAQRIRLATQIGSKLRGVLYVLDEPSIGLHPRDNGRLLETLAHLRDMGNTVLVVEHDAETIERADYVIDLGPGAGRLGGALVAAGTPGLISRNPASLTGRYLSGELEIE